MASATTEAGDPSLTASLRRAAEGDRPLERLLEAWATCPAAELAAAIERVPRADLADVTTGTAIEGRARLDRIPAARDPRIASAIAGWLADPPWHAIAAKPFYTAAFARLRAVADPRSAAALRAAGPRAAKAINGEVMRAWLVAQIEKTAAALASEQPRLAPATAELAAQAGARAASAPQRVHADPGRKVAAELLAAIHANPAEDGTRQVYGDLLVEAGDPRGELIALQLARAGREPTADERKRELALVRKHARSWLGELTAVLAGGLSAWSIAVGPSRGRDWNVRYERGFLAEVRLHGSANKLAAVAGHPELATVERLWVEHAAVLAASPLRALEELRTASTAIPAAVRMPFAPRLSWLAFTLDPAGVAAGALAACRELPALRELEIDLLDVPLDGAAVRDLLAHPTLTRLVIKDARRNHGGVTLERSAAGWGFTPSDPGKRLTLQVAALAVS